MHLKFNDLQKETPKILYDDLYVFLMRGRNILSRAASEKGIFDYLFAIEGEELSFLKMNSTSFATRPIIMVDSNLGVPVLIDRSFAARFGIIIMSVPKFERDEILSLTSSQISSMILASDQIKDGARSVARGSDALEEYAARYKDLFRDWQCFDSEFATNKSVAVLISDMTEAYSTFLGCGTSISYGNLSEFDLANPFSAEVYAFSLVFALLIGRRYSSERHIDLEVEFSEHGVYVDFSFALAGDYAESLLSDISEELASFKSVADSGGVLYSTYQKGNKFALRCFLWQSRPNSSDIKEKKKELIYNI